MLHTLLLAAALLTTVAAPGVQPTTAPSAGGYLFVTFRGEKSAMGEQIYFASSQDGRSWEALKGGEPVLVSDVGERGARDPFVMRRKDAGGAGRFVLLATDLSIYHNHDWKRAVQAASRSILIWESADLVHWAGPRLAKVAADDAGCAWAPEAAWDEAAGEYLVFWASKTALDGYAKHRIWAARTKDFVTFSAPFVYIDRPNDVIDATIVRDGERYVRFAKDEKFKAITMETSRGLMGPWAELAGFSLGKAKGYEGPTCFQMATGGWCLLLDQYSKGAGYKPFVTGDLGSGKFEAGGDFAFPYLFRHGTVMAVSDEELGRLRRELGGGGATSRAGR